MCWDAAVSREAPVPLVPSIANVLTFAPRNNYWNSRLVRWDAQTRRNRVHAYAAMQMKHDADEFRGESAAFKRACEGWGLPLIPGEDPGPIVAGHVVENPLGTQVYTDGPVPTESDPGALNPPQRKNDYRDPSWAHAREVVLAILADHREMLAALAYPGEVTEEVKLRCMAFFCHGFSDRIQLGGFHSEGDLADLAESIGAVARRDLVVVLYSCSTAFPETTLGAGSFAERLQQQLYGVGLDRCVVFGHTEPGRATKAPKVLRFGPGCADGGEWVVRPGSQYWGRWKNAMEGKNWPAPGGEYTPDDTLRYRFPFMTPDQLESELAAMPRATGDGVAPDVPAHEPAEEPGVCL